MTRTMSPMGAPDAAAAAQPETAAPDASVPVS